MHRCASGKGSRGLLEIVAIYYLRKDYSPTGELVISSFFLLAPCGVKYVQSSYEEHDASTSMPHVVCMKRTI